VNLTDGNTHRLALYLCDWDRWGRSETISILDANTQAVLSTQTFPAFESGVYGVWNVKGHVTIQVTNNDASSINSLVNGIFLDSGGAAAASYVGPDTTTQGTWTGKYGGDAQIIPGGINHQPSYGSVAQVGASTYVWTDSTTDARALQISSGATARIASTLYDGNNFVAASKFTIDANLTDGNTHRLALYLCDWDRWGRSETISILDANTLAVLSTQIFSGFDGGVYAVWNVKGHVTIQVTNNGAASINSLVNGIFLN
jgi:hypothetical protein